MTWKMNAAIAAVSAVLASPMLLAGCAAYQENHSAREFYPMTAIVVECDSSNDAVTVRDSEGQEFQFYGIEDWNVGDVASLLMDNSGTDRIFDDIIVKAHYSGFSNAEWR